MTAVESQKFFREGFVKKGWNGVPFKPWAKSNSPFTRQLMYNEGSLMHSVRVMRETPSQVVVGSDSRYGAIHNQGGTITVTAKMKRFWWAKYYEAGGGGKKLNKKAQFCRNMALQPVGKQIKMPQRQFIGESAVLMKQFDTWLKKTIEIEFTDNLNK